MNYTSRLLLSATRRLAGYTYDRLGTQSTDCSRLVFSVLTDLYGDQIASYRDDILIYDAATPWSPVTAAVAAGIAEEVVGPIPGRWHLCQGWSGLESGTVTGKSRGHAFLWYQPPSPTGERGYIVQATPLPPPWCERREWINQTQKWDTVRLVALRD